MKIGLNCTTKNQIKRDGWSQNEKNSWETGIINMYFGVDGFNIYKQQTICGLA